MGTLLRRSAPLLFCLAVAIAAPPGWAASGWKPTGAMTDGRGAHAATLLADGRVLAVSGFSGSGEVAGSEVYNPATGAWAPTGNVGVPRHYATATTLANGKVLLAGGFTAGGVTTSSELYDPATGTWTPTDALDESRSGHAAVRLQDGRVLVVGGSPTGSQPRLSAEVYDPVTGTWTRTGDLATGRDNPILAVLPDGRVLASGGNGTSPLTFHASSEIWTPATGVWSPSGALTTSRTQAAYTALADGRILAIAGVRNTGFVNTIETFTGGTWTTSGVVSPIQGNIGYAVPLAGNDAIYTLDGSASTPIYDGASNTVSSGYAIAGSRSIPTLTGLADGRVLVAGGTVSGGVRAKTAEIFTPPTTRTGEGTDLGSTVVGEPVERDVTVRNTGAARLWVEDVTVGGTDAADVAIVSETCTGASVAAAATCTVRVRFTPSAVGSRAATLAFGDNAESSPDVALTGTGTLAQQPAPEPPATPAPPAIPAPLAPEPAPTAVPTPAPTATPGPPVSKLPCTSRRRLSVRLLLNQRRGTRVRSGTATLDGKRIATVRRGARTVIVDLRRKPAKVYVLRVTFRTTKGKKVSFTRRYRTCGPVPRR